MAPQHLSATSFLSFSKRILRNQGARDCPLTFVSLPFLSLSLLVRDKFCLYLSSLLLSESSFSLQPRLPGEARPHGQTESKHRTFVKLRHVGMSIEGSNPNLMQAMIFLQNLRKSFGGRKPNRPFHKDDQYNLHISNRPVCNKQNRDVFTK